jgi:type I restriction enzyme M protein
MAGKSKAKPKAKSKPKQNGITGLLNELFQSAITMRGSIEPSDYKRYVLPLIFLRFLSLKYEKRRHELETLLADPASDYYTNNPDVRDDILNDPDEYTKVGAMMVPNEARWEAIVGIAQANDIKLRLDTILENLETSFPKLKGLLPKIYAGSNMTPEDLGSLINLFSKDVFKEDHGGIDLIGRVYEYFIGEFASTEGKRGGEYFTPESIVKTLVACMEPVEGTVFDPCCGSGGMFVQADEFTRHNGRLSFFGQESKDFTYRLCKLNLFMHGLDGDIRPFNSYFRDELADLRADFVIANPPFNDGAKGEDGWGADKIDSKDARLNIGNNRMTLAPKNANTMWMLHFLYHLKEGGTAGFVMANGALSTSTTAELETRKALVENGFVDCIVQMPDKLFANTGIPCSLWFLSKNRQGSEAYRKRHQEILFIDARKLGALMPGSRKQKELSAADIAQIAQAYQDYRKANTTFTPIEGFAKTATVQDIREHHYVLTPGRYVGSEELLDSDEPFEEKMNFLSSKLMAQFSQAALLEDEIKSNLKKVTSCV